jgi:hypothetical protein
LQIIIQKPAWKSYGGVCQEYKKQRSSQNATAVMDNLHLIHWRGLGRILR